MKTSKRLLFGTFAVMLAAPVAIVAFSRFSGRGYHEPAPPERSTPAEIAALRDFSSVDINGDFSVEIVRSDSYSVEYTPLQDNRGNFTATVRDGMLEIIGFDNRTEFAMGTVRIGMPDLEAIEVGFLPELSVSGFDGNRLNANINYVERLVIENNRYAGFDLVIQRGDLVEFHGNSFGSSTVRHFGTTITTD